MASSHRDEISRLELLHAAHPEGLVFPHLADAYRRAGRYSQAEVVLSAGLRRHADYSSAHVVLGRLRLDQGKRDEARAAFRRVLQLDPHNQVALEYLGELAAEAGQLTEALDYFRRLERFKPEGSVTGRIEEVSRRVAARARLEGAHPDGDDGGGATPHRDRPAERAHVAAEADEVVTETMAELYARQGLFARAASVYRRLLSRDPGNERLRSKLAELETEPAVAERTSESGEPGSAVGARPEPSSRPAAAAPETADGPGIREHLAAILSWRPAPSAVPGEPWAGAAVSPVPEGAVVTGYEAGAPTSGERDAPSPEPAAAAARPAAPPPATRPTLPVAELGSSETLIALSDLLVGLLEFRDPFFRGSSSLTRLLAAGVANELGLPDQERDHLALAAVLRDLGRLALGGRLLPTVPPEQTPDTRRRIARHVDLALHLLEGIRLPGSVLSAVRHHHERWDGAGYPDGLAGHDIPLPARILTVVDSFAAMVSPRSYRVPMKTQDAVRELREESGSSYDPDVVEALVRVLSRRDQPHLCFVQRPHVLLVDPDQPRAIVTAAKLCSVGYLAEVAADVTVASDRLRRVPVAALVVSAGSAGDDLAGFIQSLRADRTFAALPIVAVEADGVDWRVRLLESGVDVCFPPGVSYAELQGTLGALVRRALRVGGGARESAAGQEKSPWLALQGDVEDFPLTWLLQVMKYDSRTAAIAVRTERDDGVIYLNRGDASHARLRDGTTGEPALRRMLRWRKGRFTVQPDARPREATIRSSIMHLLLTQAVDEDHAAAGIFGAVSAEG
jgi:HD-GYP domain-containing protein (c-di-GMP phosphodiesterase class II)